MEEKSGTSRFGSDWVRLQHVSSGRVSRRQRIIVYYWECAQKVPWVCCTARWCCRDSPRSRPCCPPWTPGPGHWALIHKNSTLKHVPGHVVHAPWTSGPGLWALTNLHKISTLKNVFVCVLIAWFKNYKPNNNSWSYSRSLIFFIYSTSFQMN